MHPIIDRNTKFDPRKLGSYPKPVSACFAEIIKPSQRKGINVNSNEIVELCGNKPKLFSTLEAADVPVPRFMDGATLYDNGSFDFNAYDRNFEGATAVVRNDEGSTLINGYTDIVKSIKATESWKGRVVYEQINDFMYRVEIVATRLKQVQYREEKRDHVIQIDHNNFDPGAVSVAQFEQVATHIATALQADFIRITIEWSPMGFYVTNVTTRLSEDTIEAAKSIIQRRVRMGR